MPARSSGSREGEENTPSVRGSARWKTLRRPRQPDESTWAKKGSKRWRYYVSQAALQGDKSKAGSVVRIPAATIEHCVADVISKQSADRSSSQAHLRDLIDRVTIGRAAIQVQLSEAAETDVGARTLTVP